MKIQIFDSTLRDGAQGEGIAFSVDDKLAICKKLDSLGIDFIEGGNPASNPKDREFFEKAKKLELKNAKLVAFTSTHRVGEVPQFEEILAAETEFVCIFGKSWLLHVEEILRCTPEQNLEIIKSTIEFFKSKNKRVFFDAEHFFDGYKDNAAYAMQVLETASNAGAETLVLCDTNGGAIPFEIVEIVREIGRDDLGIHCHNDAGMAVASSICAVNEGVQHVQGTFCGYGERCGNANLCTIIPTLQLKMGLECIPKEKMKNLVRTSRFVCETANMTPYNGAPYVGSSAFAHKGGMHSDAVIKMPRSFEHIDPSLVGNERRILLSDVAGRSALMTVLSEIAPEISRNDEVTHRILDKLKELEHKGFQFEGAEGSLELLVLRELGKYKKHFDLGRFQVTDDGATVSAFIKIYVDGVEEISGAEGHGPVNALDNALRAALMRFYPELEKMRLLDYKVRILGIGEATASTTRVLITSTDGERKWTTIGISQDIIDASWQALVDSIEYFLG